ncbi:AAA family ATPase [Streptomyces asoensis]|uniref:AAA family ATPase n=1 Tax=Streptomyces asoensis TaxID=249586 RepID=UPI003791DE41
MSTLILVHLTSVGPDKQSASVDFDPHLTVIYGASESGKSYIVEAIDYMLGATKLKSIEEAEGYTHILLGIRQEKTGDVFTLCRELDGNKVEVFEGDLRSLPTRQPNQTLNLKHSPTAENNVSRYLLKILGLDGKHVLQNARRKLRTLSFRDLAHLSIIHDTPMADPRSPVLASGMKTKETEDKSVFRLLLTGVDEPEGPTGASEVEKKVGKGKIDLLDQLITDTARSLTTESSETDLKAQLARLEKTLSKASADTSELITQRNALIARDRILQTQAGANDERAGELRTLIGRFGLLRQQYESDLDRLRMVAEAGSLLGYFFREGPCIFCGAEPEHQQPGHQMAEADQLQIAVVAEANKTNELHADLLTTMEDLGEQLSQLEGENASITAASRLIKEEIGTLDGQLAPLNEDARALDALRTKIQANLALHAQIQRLENLKATLSNTPSTPTPVLPDGIPAATIVEFEQTMHAILKSWQIPGDNLVSYNQKTAEISVDNRPRSSRGRGMRSIIHAAFTMALAHYAAERDLPHPGFVVLDSPLLTYREPDEDFKMPRNVIGHFYRALHAERSAQVIVVENIDPPQDLKARVTLHPFHTSGAERMGFYPV